MFDITSNGHSQEGIIVLKKVGFHDLTLHRKKEQNSWKVSVHCCPISAYTHSEYNLAVGCLENPVSQMFIKGEEIESTCVESLQQARLHISPP